MIVVTGGAGFIGSNLVAALNARGHDDILVVDDLADGRKCLNLADLAIRDYMDRDEFIRRARAGETLGRIDAVLHQGALTDTTERDGRRMMALNHEYSRDLLAWCERRRIRFLYASSAAVYGAGADFREARECERPLNVYAFSKLVFDSHVRARLGQAASQIAGLRYFNVYGPREAHKGAMASMVLQCDAQLRETGRIRLFEGSHGCAPGGQRRDFVHVDDVVAANLWLLDHPQVSGLFNVGTGQARSFNDLARAVIAWHRRGEIDYVPFPPQLAGQYQSFTEADLSALRAAGYDRPFTTLESGVARYLDWLAARRS